MTWKVFLFFSSIFSCHITYIASSTTVELPPYSLAEAVVGSQAQIPCGIEIDGLVQLIRFTKQSGDTIYTFDVRKGINDAIHRTNFSRMSFSLLQKPLHLEIKDIVASDQGFYECNFFYERKKKYTHVTYLTVIIPPEQIRIYDSSGKEVNEVAGPFKENSTVQITCQVTGGRPIPVVKWWLAGSLLDETIDSRATNVLRNTLTIGPLKRSHLNTKYVCQASNTNFTASISKQIQLDVHYKPLTINITTPESPLVANEIYKIQCVSSGGRPPAVLTWWLDKQHIMNASTDYTTDSGNTTLSTLTFAPKDADGGKKLECRSESPEVEHSALTAHWVLDIHYAPKANVTLSPNREIKEGDSARLECHVTANPPLTNVTWYHKGRKVEGNKWENIQIENTSLILSSTIRQMSGPFTCVASNQVGIGDSNAVVLTVQYIPVCSTEENELVGASHRETVLVHCRLKAQPKISSIRWQFNSSGELIDIAEDQYIVDTGGRMSLLNYTVKTVDDYGVLLCWGKNPMGEQVEPCIFNVIEASLPDKPTNCTQVNQTANTVFVKCIGGHDGGLPQSFAAEVFDMSRKEIIRNVSFTQPLYPLKKLPSGTDFLVTIYSMNSKGSSEQQVLQVYTNYRADSDIFGFPSTHVFPITPILGVLIGVVGALVLVAIIVIVVMKLRSGAAEKNPPGGEEGNKPLGAAAPTPRDGGELGECVPPNDLQQTDCCEIPNKLKHANFYETPPTFKPNQNGNHPTETKSDDSDNLEYAELNFKSGKSKNKKKKSSKSNGKVHSSKDTTIYASIDHVQTEKQKLINSRKGKDKNNEQKQFSKGPKTEAPSPPPSPPAPLNPPSIVSSTIRSDQVSLSMQPQQPKSLLSNVNQSQRTTDLTQPLQSNPESTNQAPNASKHREIASKKSSGKPTNLDKPAIPKKPAALAPEVIKQKKKKTVETQTPDSSKGGPEEKGKKIERNFGASENIPENFPLIEVTVESNL